MRRIPWSEIRTPGAHAVIAGNTMICFHRVASRISIVPLYFMIIHILSKISVAILSERFSPHKCLSGTCKCLYRGTHLIKRFLQVAMQFRPLPPS